MEIKIGEINGAALAYLGDAVIELLVRRDLVKKGTLKVGEMNRISDELVRASSQSVAADKIISFLTEDELAVFKRGKNARVNNLPKSATFGEYKKATGLEALFAYLYLTDNHRRMEQIFEELYISE